MKKFRNVHVQCSFNIVNMQSHAKHKYLNTLLLHDLVGVVRTR